ncbi:CotH kinase family protein [Myxococcota bacterium]|nr:CotH kinase family protein [Myxococcota bacterium]
MRAWLTCLCVFALVLTGCGGPGPIDPGSLIVLNEIDCHGTDWIEIANRGDVVVDTGGWYVTDALDKSSHFYQFPAGTAIVAGGRLVVKTEGSGRPGFSFGIKCDGESIYLLDSDKTLIDQADLGGVPDGYTLGRSPDKTGEWMHTLPTQGSANLATPDTPAGMFDPNKVGLFEITLSQDAITALNADPYEYVAGTVAVTVDGQALPAETVGVRLKSGFSFQPLSGKSSFKLRADGWADDDRVAGLMNFTLNNMVDDRTMMHETLAYAIFRAAGISAPRTGYAEVKVNGESYGLYVVIETYDEQFTTQNFASTQHLYEGSADLYAGQIAQFDIEDGDELDTTDLETLMTKVASQGTGWLAGVQAMADMDSITAMWAIEHFIGHSDGYSLAANNYFLHCDDNGLFTMMPWGTDRTFIDVPVFGQCTSIFCSNCMDVAECRAMYDSHLDALPSLASSIGLAAMIDSVATTIAPYAASDQRKPYTVAEHDAAVAALKTWLDDRLALVAE